MEGLYGLPLATSVMLLSIIYFLIAWSAVWKAIAMWFAGKHQQKVWFICIAIFNTLGILPILYIFFFQKEPLCKSFKKKGKKK